MSPLLLLRRSLVEYIIVDVLHGLLLSSINKRHQAITCVFFLLVDRSMPATGKTFKCPLVGYRFRKGQRYSYVCHLGFFLGHKLVQKFLHYSPISILTTNRFVRMIPPQIHSTVFTSPTSQCYYRKKWECSSLT